MIARVLSFRDSSCYEIHAREERLYCVSRMGGLWWGRNECEEKASLDGRRVNQNSAVLTVSRPFRSTTNNRVSFVFVSKVYTHIYISVLLRSFVFIFVIINSCETTYVDIESVYKGDTFFQEWYIVNLVENTCDAVLFFREYNNVDDGYSWIWNEIIRASFFAYVKRNILAFVFVLLFISTVVVERVFWLSFVVNLVVKRKLDIEKYVDRR